MKRIFFCGMLAVLAAGQASADVVPEQVSCVVKPLYGYRQDRSPGRIVAVRLKGPELKGEVSVDVAYKKLKETSTFRVDAKDSAEVEIMLPSALPMDKVEDESHRGTDAALDGVPLQPFARGHRLHEHAQKRGDVAQDERVGRHETGSGNSRTCGRCTLRVESRGDLAD